MTMKKILILMLSALSGLCALGENRLYIEDFTIAPGETKTVTVNLENDATFTAAQWLMSLPEGLSIETRSNGRPKMSLVSDRVLGDGDDDHVVGTNFVSSGIQVLIYSPTSVPFVGSSGPFVTFKVTAADDFTGSDVISLSEITATTPNMVEYNLDDSQCTVSSTVPDPSGSSNRIYMEDFSITPGETKPVTVYLENEDALSGMQFRLTLPAGLSIVTGATGRPRVTLAGDHLDGEDDDHTVSANAAEDGIHVILYSPTSMELTTGDGALLTFNVTAASNFIGSDEIVIDQIESSTAGMVEIALEDASCVVTSSIPTAIDDVVDARTVVSTRYVSPSGLSSSKPFNGVNIVVKTMDDGSQVVTRVLR